ncbi:hypothetical protein BJV82DRAFT_709099 [Fennellomyces sp. T-0311]|nr:hypothetical protein BJV82DRAFT_709099 [Fennellomyces sp. T-0311]
MAAASTEDDNQTIALVFFIRLPEQDGVPEQTRRFEILGEITYGELHKKVKEAFGLKSKFHLTFDEHNTTITMTDDSDLNHLVDKQRGYVLNDEQPDPVVWMTVVVLPYEDDQDEEWYLKAARWVLKAGRVILIVAAPVLHVFGEAVAERLPPPYSQMVLAATAAARKAPELLGNPFSQALLAAAAAFASVRKKDTRRLLP